MLILRSREKTAEVPREELLWHWENMKTFAVVSACYGVIGIALQYQSCLSEDMHTHAAPAQMEHGSNTSWNGERADGTTLPWPGLSSDLCSRLVVMHQRSEDRYRGPSTSPQSCDWLHLERQRVMGVWRHVVALDMQHTGRLGLLYATCWVLLLMFVCTRHALW